MPALSSVPVLMRQQDGRVLTTEHGKREKQAVEFLDLWLEGAKTVSLQTLPM